MNKDVNWITVLCEAIVNFPPLRFLLYLVYLAGLVGSLKKKYYLNPARLEPLYSQMSLPGSTSSLDLGCGIRPRNPFQAESVFGADVRGDKHGDVIYADIATGQLPFSSESFDYVTAYDLLEHIQRNLVVDGKTTFPFVVLVNEIYRVLKPGGVFFSIQPCFPSKQALQDPTHINIMSEDTMYKYFCEPVWGRIYGYTGTFEMLQEGWVSDKYFSFMRKSGEHPVLDRGFVQT
jgi:SAM-dependent methyltransferase